MIVQNKKNKTYTGITHSTFKQRLATHKQSFKNKNVNQTSLSSYIWKLKDKKLNFTIKWETLFKANSFLSTSGRCDLCTMEKYHILFKPEFASLNNNNEMLKKCRHKNSLLLVNSVNK